MIERFVADVAEGVARLLEEAGVVVGKGVVVAVGVGVGIVVEVVVAVDRFNGEEGGGLELGGDVAEERF